jgi:hypothetical protein
VNHVALHGRGDADLSFLSIDGGSRRAEGGEDEYGDERESIESRGEGGGGIGGGEAATGCC